VRLEVFDLLGRRVKLLALGDYPAGRHAVEWDRQDASGAAAKPGVQVYRLIAGDFRDQKKMVLLP
jgi:flagellar hook assembly protein FlgD